MLEREGEVGFWTVRMRPGKPLAFGTFPAPDGRRVPHIGLPGNPVSSMVAFELFGRPALFKMIGRERLGAAGAARDRSKTASSIRTARRFYARAIVQERDGRYYASLTGPQGSGILTSMALANALVICPEDQATVEPGDEADAMVMGPI